MTSLSGKPGPAAERPRLRPAPTAVDVALDVLGALGLVFVLWVIVRTWPELPAQVPSHYGPSGLPDAWGPKSRLIILPALSLALYVGLSVLTRFPYLFNYLWPITEKNAHRQYRLANSMLRWERTWIIWVLAYIAWSDIRVALGRASGLGVWWLGAFLVVTFGILAAYLLVAGRQAGEE